MRYTWAMNTPLPQQLLLRARLTRRSNEASVLRALVLVLAEQGVRAQAVEREARATWSQNDGNGAKLTHLRALLIQGEAVSGRGLRGWEAIAEDFTERDTTFTHLHWTGEVEAAVGPVDPEALRLLKVAAAQLLAQTLERDTAPARRRPSKPGRL